MSYEGGKADDVQSPKINFYVFSQGIHPPKKNEKLPIRKERGVLMCALLLIV